MIASSPEQTGKWVALVLFGCLSAFFAMRAFQATTQSRRFGALAIAMGCLVLVRPETASGRVPSDDPTLFRILGWLRIVVGLSGVVLAVFALRARRIDRQTGIVGPAIGMLLCILHGLVGAYYLVLISSGFSSPEANSATAWTYKVTNLDLEIRFPSDKWKEYKMRNGATAFAQRLPEMVFGIHEAKSNQTVEDFRASELMFRKHIQETANISAGQFREGVNPAGHSYVFYSGIEEPDGGKKRIYLATCLYWCSSKGIIVHLMFEGKQQAASDVGQESEMKTFRVSAEAILMSVK